MKCTKCGVNEEKYKTVEGKLCETCYENSLFKVKSGDEVRCIYCGSLIPCGDFYAVGSEGETLCTRCFQKPAAAGGDAKKAFPPHGLSTFIYVISFCAFAAGIALIFVFGILPGIFIGIVAGSILLGLGKAVYAAEIYIWNNEKDP